MAKSKLNLSTLDINKKFSSEEEAYLYAKRLKEFIRYTCYKNRSKDYLAQALICVSNLKKDVSNLQYINSGLKGRPKKQLIIYESIANNWYLGNYNTDWHIHILLVSKPSYAFREIIKKYIDKNWINVSNIKDKQDFDINKIKAKKVYKKNCNIKIADYFIQQSSKILFCNYNYGNSKNLDYTLKQYYYEYLKMDSAKRKLYKENANNNLAEDEYLKRYNKIESKFKLIENYFYDVTKEQKEKKEYEFMKQIKYSKIKDNYSDNKVQDIHRDRLWDNSLF